MVRKPLSPQKQKNGNQLIPIFLCLINESSTDDREDVKDLKLLIYHKNFFLSARNGGFVVSLHNNL